jgi:hypothetical protein
VENSALPNFFARGTGVSPANFKAGGEPSESLDTGIKRAPPEMAPARYRSGALEKCGPKFADLR